MAEQLIDEFCTWILSQSSPSQPIEKVGDHNFRIENEAAAAEVNVYSLEMVIVELSITNKTNNENAFFLHFELNDLRHAQELFQEMMDAFNDIKNRKKIRILLCCTSGLTTSFFAAKLNETAEYLNLDYEFNAVSYSEVFDEGIHYSMILLAPQIAYLYEKISAVLKNQIVVKLPAKIFGSYDAAGAVQLVSESLQSHNLDQSAAEDAQTVKDFQPVYGDYGISLIIGIENSSKTYRLRWRIYNECTMLDDGVVRKRHFRLRDFDDLIDTALLAHPEIQYVYIASPGTVVNGKLTFPFFNIIDVNIVEMYEKKYGRFFSICNDANAIARGYYEDHKEQMHSLALYYTPMLCDVGGAGIILGGKLYHGQNDSAGEIPSAIRILRLSDDRSDLARTPEGQTELTAKVLLMLYAVLSPDVLAFCNPMISDSEDVRAIIAKYVRPSLMPEIIKVDDTWENMMWGAILLGMEDLHQRGIIQLHHA